MFFIDLVNISKQYYPNLNIKYKGKSFLKNNNTIFFDNNDIYYPSNQFLHIHPISSGIILFHQLYQIENKKKYGFWLYNFLYLSPQIFFILLLPLLFISWKFLFLIILCLLPIIPSYFRMKFEKEACISSLYVIYQISNKLHFKPHLDLHNKFFLKQFKHPYLWLFPLNKKFDKAIIKIENNEIPFKHKFFDIFNEILNKI